MTDTPTEVADAYPDEVAVTVLEGEDVDVMFEIIDSACEDSLELAEPLHGETIEQLDLSVENATVTTESGRTITVLDPRISEISNAVLATADESNVRAAVGSREQIIVQYWDT